MKKVVLLLAVLFIGISLRAQDEGIQFYKGSWDEAVNTAKKEKKKIFIDFFTEWCGPCLTMALEVFPRPEVGAYYNREFICLKIDAEKGEGRELSQKYEIRSYPSYIYVDPKTEKILHRSGGNKSAADFIADAEGALNKKLSSIYIEKKFKSGKYDLNFLKQYVRRRKVAGDRNLSVYFDELTAKGASLNESDMWELFYDCLSGYRNRYFMEVSDHYDHYVALYGKQRVDMKLKKETTYAPVEFIRSLADFEGKESNIKLVQLTELFRAKEFNKAFDMVDRLLIDPKVDQQALLNSLAFYMRVNPKYGEDEVPFELLTQKVKYMRYIAYNCPDRNNAINHYYYAASLEYLIKRAVKEGIAIPTELFETPVIGKSQYDMRHPLLKPKPKRRR